MIRVDDTGSEVQNQIAARNHLQTDKMRYCVHHFIYLDSMSELRPNTIGRGPAHVGVIAAIADGFTRPFFVARRAMVAAWPPPNTTSSSPE